MLGLIGTAASAGAARWATVEAFRLPSRSLTFEGLDALAGRLAGGLAGRGVAPGDRVVLHLPNDWQWIVAYHAIARLGAVVVPANNLLTAAEIAYIIADSGARLAILSKATRAIIGNLVEAIVIDDPSAQADIQFDALLAADWRAPVTLMPDDLFTIGYTSGTTGRPKGAMLSQGAVATSVAMTATVHVRHEHDRVFSALPFAHVYGNVVMNACVLTGATLFVPQRFDAGAALATIAQERITLFEGVPTMYYQMLGSPLVADTDLSSLTRCTVGGQSMPTAKIAAVVARFGCPLLELWGMTEVGGPAITHSPYWAPRPGSIGLPFPGTSVRIAAMDRPGEQGGPDDAGEIQIRGPQVMQGYWGNPDATAATLDADGWFATGDVGRIDADGYVFVVDRLKDVIITGGYKIYPAEVEQVLALHPAVAISAVAGVADDEKGEVAQAFIVLAAGHDADADALDKHCRAGLAAYKVPRRYAFVTDLPKTSTGKIMRRALGDIASKIPA